MKSAADFNLVMRKNTNAFLWILISFVLLILIVFVVSVQETNQN